jgi:uncharacterized DUF497 family protein
MTFTWDKNKAKTNLLKHGISFEEAHTAFFDEKALLIHDPFHSKDEDRFIIFGLTVKLRVVAVCHCYREDDEVIRIISARKATNKEIKQYEEV